MTRCYLRAVFLAALVSVELASADTEGVGGRVVMREDLPVPGATVNLCDTKASPGIIATTTDSAGHFLIRTSPGRDYVIWAELPGYARTGGSPVVILPGQSTSTVIRMMPCYLMGYKARFPGDLPLSRNLSCQVISSRRRYSVGDALHVRVSILNVGESPVSLVRDGGRGDAHVRLRVVAGPDGGFREVTTPWCGPARGIESDDLASVSPGNTFAPFEQDEAPLPGTFERPGEYVLRFEYSLANDCDMQSRFTGPIAHDLLDHLVDTRVVCETGVEVHAKQNRPSN